MVYSIVVVAVLVINGGSVSSSKAPPLPTPSPPSAVISFVSATISFDGESESGNSFSPCFDVSNGSEISIAFDSISFGVGR